MDALSDQLFLLALPSYAAAMLGFAVGYLRQPEPANATAPNGHPHHRPPATVDTRTGTAPDRYDWASGVGIAATVIGAAAQVGSLVTRATGAGPVPWGTMYEFIIALTLVAVLAWLCLAARHRSARPLGLYVTLIALALLGAAGMRLHSPAGPLVPALTSGWLIVQVTAAVVASGIFLTGFLAAAAHLLRARHDVRLATGTGTTGLDDSLAARLPAAHELARHTFWLHVAAFPIWTLVVLASVVGADPGWGRDWGWEPTEAGAAISWFVYAGYLLSTRVTTRPNRTTAWIAVAGWATMWVNLFGANLVISGLNSYTAT